MMNFDASSDLALNDLLTSALVFEISVFCEFDSHSPVWYGCKQCRQKVCLKKLFISKNKFLEQYLLMYYIKSELIRYI